MKKSLIVLLLLAIVGTIASFNALQPERQPIDETRMLARINGERYTRGLVALQSDPMLEKEAQERAEGLCNVQLSHDNYLQELYESGYPYAHAGENLAEGFYNTDLIVTAWINSPTHYENIVKPEYREIGIGVADCGHKQVIVNWFGTKK